MRVARLLPALLLLVSCASGSTPASEMPAEVEDDAGNTAAGEPTTQTEEVPRPATTTAPDPYPALARDRRKLEHFADRPPPRGTPFDRDDWNHWTDDDGDCQDTRAEVLIEQSREPVKFASPSSCRVVAGLWVDPYTGETFTDAGRLEIDHVVPLEEAHESGAWAWTSEQRETFANDPFNLVAVSASATRSKGARSPDQWMPPNRHVWCRYVWRWWAVKSAYRLGEDEREREGIAALQLGCTAPGTPPAVISARLDRADPAGRASLRRR